MPRSNKPIYGELNPINVPRMARGLTNDEASNINLLDTIREATYDYTYGFDALKDTGPFYGIVVQRIENNGNLPLSDSLTRFLGASAQSFGENLIAVRVRIPELHAHLPDPFDQVPNSPAYRNFAAAHPTFVGYDTVQPEVGMVVQVDFQNKQDFTGPIYMGTPQHGQYSNLKYGPDGNVHAPKNAFNESEGTTNVEDLGEEYGVLPSSGNALNGEPSPSVVRPVGKVFNPHPVTVKTRQLPREVNDIRKLRGVEDEMPQFIWDNLPKTLRLVKVVQKFWRQMYPTAIVEVKSCVRKKKTGYSKDSRGAHGHGIATDVSVNVDGKRLPVDQVHAGYKKLIDAGKLPKGGLGLYVNVKDWNGWGGPPSKKKKSKSRLPPGGSSWNHYDWRGTPNDKGEITLKRKGGQRWVWLDVDADAVDELSTDGVTTRWGGQKISKKWLKKNYPEIYNLAFGDAWKTWPGVPNVNF